MICPNCKDNSMVTFNQKGGSMLPPYYCYTCDKSFTTHEVEKFYNIEFKIDLNDLPEMAD